MIVTDAKLLVVAGKEDIVDARKRIASTAGLLGMSRMKETEILTAATELLTNILRYAGSGTVKIEQLEHNGLKGIRAVCEDQGPGIINIEEALSKGFSTGKGLGLGLSGCKNLVDSFDLQSAPGKGTRVVITKWC